MNESEKPDELADYPIMIELPIQWGDQDLFGHVNNTIHIRWFESARVKYMEECGFGAELRQSEIGPILASITCNYRQQLNYPDTLLIGARINRIGRTSLVMEHLAYSQSLGASAADGQSVIVMFNYASQQPEAVSDELRATIERLEGRSLA